MADVKITQLPLGAVLDGTEEVPVVQGLSTKRVPTQAIANLLTDYVDTITTAISSGIVTATAVRVAAEAVLSAGLAAEITARTTADGLLIPLTQRGAVLGVATLDAAAYIPDGQIPTNITRDIELAAGLATRATTVYVDAADAVLAAAVALLIPLAQKGAPSGVASLDGSAQIFDAQIPASITRDSELTAAVAAAVAALIASAPGTLNTLDELAAALGDDPNFAASIAALIGAKAATAYVDAADALLIPLTQKGAISGVATLDGSGFVPDAQIPATIARDSEITSAVSVEASARSDADALLIPLTEKGAVSGVATLDGSGLIPDAQIPAGIARDSETTAAVAAEASARSDADALLIPLTQRGAASGVATLDVGGLIPDAQIPAGVARDAETTAAVSAEATARSDADALLIPLTQKGAVSGVATLDGSGLIPDAQIPAGIARDSETTAAVSTETTNRTNADALLIPLAQKGAASGVATLDAGGLIPTAQLPPDSFMSIAKWGID